MKRVAASEALILTVARAVVGQETPGAAEWILTRAVPLPQQLGPTSIALLRDTLARGIVLELVRRGGGEPRAHLSGGPGRSLSSATVIEGRLWDRHTLPDLEFSDFPLQLLRWMVAYPLRDHRAPAPIAAAQTPGDALFAYLAFDLCRRAFATQAAANARAFRSIPLVWLAFADYLMNTGTNEAPNDFTALAVPESAFILEGLQSALARRWIEILQHSARLETNAEMTAYGRSVRRVLDRMLIALAAEGRPDLARFFLQAAASVLDASPDAARFIERLEKTGKLSEQIAARGEALAFIPALERLRSFAEEARGARFFDEHYDASQLYLRIWETVGDARLERARRIAQDIGLAGG